MNEYRPDARPLEDLAIYAAVQSGGQILDLPTLETAAREWIRLVCQKTGGQSGHADRGTIDFCHVPRVRMDVLSQGVALGLSGILQEAAESEPGAPFSFLPYAGRDTEQMEQTMLEKFYGKPFSPEILERLAGKAREGLSEEERMVVVVETIAIALSRKLEKPWNEYRKRRGKNGQD